MGETKESGRQGGRDGRREGRRERCINETKMLMLQTACGRAVVRACVRGRLTKHHACLLRFPPKPSRPPSPLPHPCQRHRRLVEHDHKID